MKRGIAFFCPPLTHFHLVTLLRTDVEFFPNIILLAVTAIVVSRAESYVQPY